MHVVNTVIWGVGILVSGTGLLIALLWLGSYAIDKILFYGKVKKEFLVWVYFRHQRKGSLPQLAKLTLEAEEKALKHQTDAVMTRCHASSLAYRADRLATLGEVALRATPGELSDDFRESLAETLSEYRDESNRQKAEAAKS